MKLAGTWLMIQLCMLVAFTFSPNKSSTNRNWPPLGDWPLQPNHVRYRNVWYLVGKIIFSQKLKFLPWSSDAFLAIKVHGRKRPPGFQRSKMPGAHRVKWKSNRSSDAISSLISSFWNLWFCLFSFNFVLLSSFLLFPELNWPVSKD